MQEHTTLEWERSVIHKDRMEARTEEDRFLIFSMYGLWYLSHNGVRVGRGTIYEVMAMAEERRTAKVRTTEVEREGPGWTTL